MSHRDPSLPATTFRTPPEAPTLPGLGFRLFQGEADIPALNAVREAMTAADGDLWLPGPDTDTDASCDPTQDCLLAEVDGKVIGYTWLDWWTEADRTQLYLHLGWLVPKFRRKGIGRALLRWQEQRLRQIAQPHLTTGTCLFGGNADETQPGNRALLLSEGYSVAFTKVFMTCQVPTTLMQPASLPDDLEVRPVELEQLPAIYAANDEAFADSRLGYSIDHSEDFLRELGWPELDTSLWVVAWDGDQIAGLVISTSDEEGAHTPWVAVRRPWRQRGLGKALMTRTIQRFQARGITQAELHPIAENSGKSVHLYESVGYQVVKRQPRYRKLMGIVARFV